MLSQQKQKKNTQISAVNRFLLQAFNKKNCIIIEMNAKNRKAVAHLRNQW